MDFTSTPTITGVVYSTTTTINVDPGDPWAFDSYTTGVDLRGTGGDWEYDAMLTLAGDTVTTLIENPDPWGGYALWIKQPMVATIEGDYPDGEYIINNPASINGVMKAYTTDTSKTVVLDMDYLYLYDGATLNAKFGLDSQIESSLLVRDGHIVAKDNGASFLIPQVATIATLDGGIAGEYIGCETDLHVGDGSYLANGCVIGRGAQDHSQDGSLWLETAGSFTAPYSGYQETRIYTDRQGTHLINKLHAFNEGNIASWFCFDADIATSNSLRTSETLSLEGSSYEGQATISAANSSVTVSTSLISDTDVVLLTYTTLSNGGGALWVDDIDPGVSFDINSSAATSDDTNVSWKIIK